MKYIKQVLLLLILVSFINPVKAIEIEDIKEAGTYFVEINAADEQGNSVKKEARILVTFRNTIVNADQNEAIDGVDIRLVNEDIMDLSDTELIAKGKVRAWDINTTEPVTITSINIEVLGNDKYIVSFSTKNNTTISLNAYKIDEGGLNLESSYLKPLSKKHYNIPKVIQFVSVIVFIPIIVVSLTYLKVNKEHNQINQLLYKEEKE